MRAAFMTAVDAVEVREDVAPPELDPAGEYRDRVG